MKKYLMIPVNCDNDFCNSECRYIKKGPYGFICKLFGMKYLESIKESNQCKRLANCMKYDYGIVNNIHDDIPERKSSCPQ